MEKELTLSDMKKKPDKKVISVDEAKKIDESAKREIKAKEVSEAVQKEKDEILALVDDRIDRLAEENKYINAMRNKAKQEKKEKELLESSNKDDLSYDDYDIPDDDFDIMEDDIDMDIKEENKLEIYDESSENETETNKHSTIDIEECDEKEDIVIVSEENEDTNSNNTLISIIDKPNDKTVMKISKGLPDIEAKPEDIDDNDFKEILKETELPQDNTSKDYIEIPDSDEFSEISKEEMDVVYSEEELEEAFTQMRKNLTKILHPVKNKIDISQFKLGEPISLNNATPTRHKDVAEHVLWNSKRTITFEELEGFEVNELAAPLEQGVSEYSQTLRKMTILYDHIKSKKPIDVITWLKTTRDDDLDHVYGAGYIGSFKNSNIMIGQCGKCQSPYISQDIPIMDVVKFKDDSVKEKYYDMLNNPDDSPYKIEGKAYQISDDYIMKIKTPSIWKSRLEPLLLDPQFRNKYSTIIEILKFVDTIYKIDRENMTYRPIDYTSDFKKDEKNRSRKILMNKIKKYGAIITKALTPNEFQKMWMCVNKEIKANETDDIKYIIPKRVCPKCNHVDDEVIVSAEDLLFTRHQLGLVASI